MKNLSSNPKLSIIVPVYNTEKYLDKCIESILNQTYKNIELILVDDGSSDNSYGICEKYLNHDSRVKLIKQKNAGAAAARNAGINICTGEYIGFVDSDDFVENDMFETLLDEILDNDVDAARICINRIISGGVH